MELLQALLHGQAAAVEAGAAGEAGMINRRKRRDANHAEVLVAFKRLGWAVIDMSQLGDGVADLMVCRHGRVIAVEVKVPGEKVRPHQTAWMASWPGETAVVRTVDDVIYLSKDIEVAGGPRTATSTPESLGSHRLEHD